MATNDFLTVANAGGANVVNQATYAAAPQVPAGWADGEVPDANLWNKMMRQSASITAMLAAFLATSVGIAMLDDGNQATKLAAMNAAFRIKLQANQTFYVNAATGNDANDGSLANPWRTLQHAYDTIASNYDMSVYSITIQGTGAFTAGVVANRYIPGNGFDPATSIPNLIFTFTAGSSIIPAGSAYGVNVETGYVYVNGGGNLSMSNAGLGCLYAQSGVLAYGGITFGAVPAGQWHVQGEAASTLIMASNCTIQGGGGAHFSLAHGAAWRCGPGLTLTVTGTPAFSTAFCNIAVNANWDNFNPGGALVIAGAATGVRYQSILCGVINPQGAGANYFPGNSAGVTSSGGQYL